jgi:hypothetical protein
LAEPVVEARRADARVVAWDERSIVQFQAEIGRVRISGHFARVVRRFQKSPDELAERRPLGTGDLDRAVTGVPSATSVIAAATSSDAMGWR